MLAVAQHDQHNAEQKGPDPGKDGNHEAFSRAVGSLQAGDMIAQAIRRRRRFCGIFLLFYDKGAQLKKPTF
jgi:hypothetical protein